MLEGLDGSGKTTQTAALSEQLMVHEVPYRQIKLPDYDDPSSTLVKMYLAGAFGETASALNAYAASSFYAVDRVASYRRHWQSSYDAGELILADRYTTSNAVHQLPKLEKCEWRDYLSWLEDFEYKKLEIPKPDLVIYLDIPVEISAALVALRYQKSGGEKDIHEKDLTYLKQCFDAALYAASYFGWHMIPCACSGVLRPVADISRDIWKTIKKNIL